MIQEMQRTMNAIALDRFGGLETMKLQTLPVPEVGPDDVLIHVKWAGVGQWDPFEREGGFAREFGIEPKFPMDGFLVPATAEPLIACTVAGSAEFEERETGGAWLRYPVRRGDLFVIRSKTPYELRWNSPSGAELEVLHIHLSEDQLTTALEAVYGDTAADVEVTEFFGRDETLAHFCFACAELLSSGTAVSAKCIAAFTHLPAIHSREIHELRIAAA